LLLRLTFLKEPTAAPTVCTIVIIELPISPVTIRLARKGISATITANRMLAKDINNAVLAPWNQPPRLFEASIAARLFAFIAVSRMLKRAYAMPQA
jgi:hypothetical protein